MSPRGWIQDACREMRLHSHGDKVPGTGGILRRHQARPRGSDQNPGMDAPEKQRGASELPGVRELLPGLCAVSCSQGATPAGVAQEESAFSLGSETPRGLRCREIGPSKRDRFGSPKRRRTVRARYRC